MRNCVDERMIASDRYPSDQETLIDSQHNGHSKISRDSFQVHDSDEFYRRVRNACRFLGKTLWLLIIFSTFNGFFLYLYSFFPSSVQVSKEIPVVLSSSKKMGSFNEPQKEEIFISQKFNKKDGIKNNILPNVIMPSDDLRNFFPLTIVSTVISQIPAKDTPEITRGQIEPIEHFFVPVTSEKKSTVPLPKGRALLQLGSFQRMGDAERAWSQLTHRHGELLGGISHAVVPVDLGMRGTWYRVYAGPYDDVQRALSICYTLKKISENCLFSLKK